MAISEYKQMNEVVKKDRRLKEQFIHGKSINTVIIERVRKLTSIKKTNERASEHALCWARRVEVWRAQKGI